MAAVLHTTWTYNAQHSQAQLESEAWRTAGITVLLCTFMKYASVLSDAYARLVVM